MEQGLTAVKRILTGAALALCMLILWPGGKMVVRADEPTRAKITNKAAPFGITISGSGLQGENETTISGSVGKDASAYVSAGNVRLSVAAVQDSDENVNYTKTISAVYIEDKSETPVDPGKKTLYPSDDEITFEVAAGAEYEVTADVVKVFAEMASNTSPGVPVITGTVTGTIGAPITPLTLWATKSINNVHQTPEIEWTVCDVTDEDTTKWTGITSSTILGGISWSSVQGEIEGNADTPTILTISGTPTEYANGKKFRFTAKDAAYGVSDSNASSSYVDVTFNVSEFATLTPTPASSESYFLNNDTVSTGYTVDDSLPCSAQNARPLTITLTNKNTEMALSNLSVSLTGEDKESFSLSSAANATSIAADSSLEFTVSPVTELKGRMIYDNEEKVMKNKPYTAKVVISSPMLAASIEYPLSLTVENDLSVTLSGGDGTGYVDEETKTIYLGKVTAGSRMTPVVLTGHSSVEGVYWGEVSADGDNSGAYNELYTTLGVSYSATGKWGSLCYDTFTIGENEEGGRTAVKLGAFPSNTETETNTVHFTLKLHDGNNNVKGYTVNLEVEPCDMAFTIDGEDPGNSYTWKVIKTEDETVDSYKKTITVENRGDTDVNVLIGNDTTPLSITLANTSVTIKAGASKQLDVKPATNPTETGSLEKEFSFSAGGMKQKKIKMKLEVIANQLTVSRPVTGSAITAATLGEAYSYRMEAIGGATTASSPLWYIASEADWTGKEGTPSLYTDEALREYGLSLNRSTGTLSGTLLKMAENNAKTLYIPIKAVRGNSSNEADTAFVLLELKTNPATNVKLSDASGRTLSVDSDYKRKGITLDNITINTTDKSSATVTIVNNTAVDLGELTVSVEKTYTNSETAGNQRDDYYGIPVSETTTVSLGANQSKTFEVAFDPTKVTLIGDNHYYKADIKVTGDRIQPELLGFTIYIKAIAAPTINASALTNASTSGNIKEGQAIAATGLVLTGTKSGSNASVANPEWTWTLLEKSNNDATASGQVVNGLELNKTTGKITGTPAVSGIYKVRIQVKDVDTRETGYKDVVFTVKGSLTSSQVYSSVGAAKLAGTTRIFNGNLTGQNNTDQMTVSVNNEAETEATDLRVRIRDLNNSDSVSDYNTIYQDHAGDSARFTLSSSVMATSDSPIYRGRPGSYVIMPNPSGAKAGRYIAAVELYGRQIDTETYYVEFYVSDPVSIQSPAPAELIKSIGDPFKLILTSTGAGSQLVGSAGADTNGQRVKWYIQGNVNDTDDSQLKEIQRRLEAAGIADVNAAISDHRIAITSPGAVTGALMTGNDGALPLEKADEIPLTIVAEADAVTKGSNSKAVVKTAASLDITLTINKSGKLYVSSAGAENDGNTVGKDSSTGYVNSFTFKSKPLGYIPTGANFVVRNETGLSASVSAKITDASGAVSDLFTITSPVNLTITNETETTYTITPKAGLNVIKTYEANLVLTGTTFKEYTVPLRFTVESATYSIKLSEGTDEIGLTGYELNPVLKGKTVANEDKQTITITNNGNMPTKIVNLYESNSSGGVKTSGNLLTLDKTQLENGDIAADETTTFGITLNADARKTAEEGTAYITIDYKSDENGGTRKVTYTLNYVIYNSPITVEYSPTDYEFRGANDALIVEGYDPAQYGKEFTITNKGASGAGNTIYNLEVRLDSGQYFTLQPSGLTAATLKTAATDTTSAVYTVRKLAPSASAAFKVYPKEGLTAKTSYFGNLHFTASNITEKNIPLTLTIGRNKEVNLKADSAGVDVAAGFQERLFTTLNTLATDSSSAVSKNDTDKVFNINLNGLGTAADTDLKVSYAADNKKATKVTLDTQHCNITKYENPITLTAATGTAGTDYFSKVTFQIQQLVEVDIKNETIRKEDNTEKTVTGEFENVTYKVPYGGKLKDVDGFAWPKVVKSGNIATEWVDLNTLNPVTDTTPITADMRLRARDHSHKYPEPTEVADSNWTWTGNATNGYTAAVLHLTCKDTNCNETRDFPAEITETVTAPSCEVTGKTTYRAVVEYDNKYYVSEKIGKEVPAKGHDWKIEENATVTWTKSGDTYTATVTATCQNTHTITDGAQTKQLELDVVKKQISGDCKTAGEVEYTATYTQNGKVIFTKSMKDPISASGIHTYSKLPTWVWAEDYSSATATFTCDVCGDTYAQTATPQKTEVTENNQTTITYTATVSIQNFKKSKDATVTTALTPYTDVKTVRKDNTTPLIFKSTADKWEWKYNNGSPRAWVYLTTTDNKTTIRVEAAVSFVQKDSKGNSVYRAQITYGSNSYSDTKTFDTNGSEQSGGGSSSGGTGTGDTTTAEAIWNLFENRENHSFSLGRSTAGTATASNTYFRSTLTDGVVSVECKTDDPKELPKAVSAANSLMTFDISDGKVGYTLPVQYVKPQLKLTKTSGTILADEGGTVSTIVTCKNAAGAFVPLDLSEGFDVDYTGNADITIGEELGELLIDAEKATSGKISIQKEPGEETGWAEPIQLAYSVKTTKKSIVTFDYPQVIVNQNADDVEYEVTVYVNGEEADDEIKLSKTTGLCADYEDDGKLLFSTDDTTKSGTITVTAPDGGKGSLKVKFSKQPLSKAIKLKIQRKYDIVTGQSMLLIPTLSEISGVIESAVLDEEEGNCEDFSAEYIESTGMIEVTYDGSSALTTSDLKTTYKTNCIITLEDGTICEIPLTFKLQKTVPTVKNTTVKVGYGDDDAEANIISIYKDSANNVRKADPVSASIVSYTGCSSRPIISGTDKLTVLINGITKNGNVKVKYNYTEGANPVTKTVTVSFKVTK